MSLTTNLAQINAASAGNSNLREALTSLHLAVQSIYAATGTGPIVKVDTKKTAFTAPPAAAQIAVTGANGSFTVSLTPASSATTGIIYQEISSSPVATFASGITVYPISSNTSFQFPNPGATLYWRVRSSFNHQNWSSYQTLQGAVSAGLQTSAASEPNLSLNQTNYATVDSVAAGSSATVRIYGSGGIGTSWTSILGSTSKVIPSGTIMNVAYGVSGFVVWDGTMYRVLPQLSQTFPDSWIPVGKVSVIANGAGLVLPTIHAVVSTGASAGAIIAYQIINGGNGLTAPPILTITDSTGTGATATAVVTAGAVTQVTPGSAGSGYSSSPTVTATGGVSGGIGGGGGPTGQNTGRFYGGTT